MPGDYDGDGRAEAAGWRPSTGVWWMATNQEGIKTLGWGEAGDIPVPGDYDNDGGFEPAVWRPSTAVWHISPDTEGASFVQWGLTNDIPRPGDYDGDGRFEPAVWRPSTGVWHIRHSNYAVSPVAARPDALSGHGVRASHCEASASAFRASTADGRSAGLPRRHAASTMHSLVFCRARPAR